MASLIVGGVTIPVAISSPAWSRTDAVDRGRMFDGTFFASESGGASRDWTFSTTPVTQADADTYIAALSSPAAKLCSGDILQIPTMCSPELPSGKPTRAGSANRVVLDFMLHEVQPAKVLLRYTPGDAIGSFSRASTARYYTSAGLVASAATDVKRDSHYVGGVRSLLLEDARTNGLLRSEELEHAAWTKTACTVAVTGTAPDGGSARKIEETAATSRHSINQGITTTASTLQSFTVFAKAAERSWLWVRTLRRDGTAPFSWVNLSTGVVGTVSADHTVRITPGLASSWYRIEVVFNSMAGGGATDVEFGPSTADNVSSYLGALASGVYAWGAQHEQDAPFASSYIPTAGTTVTRSADSQSIAFTPLPQEMTVYAKFVEGGTVAVSGKRIFEVGIAASSSPRFIVQAQPTVYGVFHGNGIANVTSNLAAGPAQRDVVELNARLFGDGSEDLTQSLNGAAATSSTQSAANALASAWSDDILWLNSGGTSAGSTGFMALQSFKVVAGARSLVETRAL